MIGDSLKIVAVKWHKEDKIMVSALGGWYEGDQFYHSMSRDYAHYNFIQVRMSDESKEAVERLLDFAVEAFKMTKKLN